MCYVCVCVCVSTRTFVSHLTDDELDVGLARRVAELERLAALRTALPAFAQQQNLDVLCVNNLRNAELRTTALAGLVHLAVSSIGTTCTAPIALLAPPPAKKFPIELKSKAMLAVQFDVTFDCANDPAKTTKQDPGHDDFRFTATVTRAASGDAYADARITAALRRAGDCVVLAGEPAAGDPATAVRRSTRGASASSRRSRRNRRRSAGCSSAPR